MISSFTKLVKFQFFLFKFRPVQQHQAFLIASEWSGSVEDASFLLSFWFRVVCFPADQQTRDQWATIGVEGSFTADVSGQILKDQAGVFICLLKTLPTWNLRMSTQCPGDLYLNCSWLEV